MRMLSFGTCAEPACFFHLCSVRTMTGNGSGGTLPALKSAGDLAAIGRSCSPTSGKNSANSSAVDLPGMDASTRSFSSSASRPQGEEAVMSASGFVHAQGEHVSALGYRVLLA